MFFGPDPSDADMASAREDPAELAHSWRYPTMAFTLAGTAFFPSGRSATDILSDSDDIAAEVADNVKPGDELISAIAQRKGRSWATELYG